MMNWPFDIDACGASARDYLNLMVTQYEDMTWHVTRAGALCFYMPDKAADAVRESIRANQPEAPIEDPSCTATARRNGDKYAGTMLTSLSYWSQASVAQQDIPVQDEQYLQSLRNRLKPIGDSVKRRLADKARQRRSLDRKISVFVATNAPLYYVVSSLRDLGIQVCYEVVPVEQAWYMDNDGVPAFPADTLISIAAKESTVRSILDRICAADPRYKWVEDQENELVVLAPKENSRLDFLVGPVKDAGNPVDVLERIDHTFHTALAPLFRKGDNNLPRIELDAPRCSAKELLNRMAAQKPGLTWGFGGRVQFTYVSITSADAVRIEFPELRKGQQGQPVNMEWRYKVVEGSMDGISTMQVKKRWLAKPDSEKVQAFTPVPKPGAAVARQLPPQATEQNVVASRLAGAWKLEPGLTERLRGDVTGPGTMVFVADSDVKAKVPAKFLDAAKREGITIDIRLAGYMEMGGTKHPFILATFHGNPHIFYFRERGGDPFGDSESFNVMLAPAKDRKNDLLFIGGDFNNQPFRAYARADSEK